MRLLAHAKINLSLGITGLLPDGYHQVEMIMQSLELADQIDLSLTRSKIEISGDQPYIPWNQKNLAYKAATLLQKNGNCSRGVQICIRKKIPTRAGLGGGSADAAAVLLGLNELWQLGLSLEKLQELALQLGSDVPFCLSGGCALASGRGEKLQPLPCRIQPQILLLKPPWGVSTAKAYQEYDCQPAPLQPDNQKLARALAVGDWAGIKLVNALEEPVFRLYPQLRVIKKALYQTRPLGVLMTGSGSCIYGLYSDLNQAQTAMKKILAKWPRMQAYCTSFSAQGVNQEGGFLCPD